MQAVAVAGSSPTEILLPQQVLWSAS